MDFHDAPTTLTLLLRDLRPAMRLLDPILAGPHTAPPHLALRAAPNGETFLQARDFDMEIDVLIPASGLAPATPMALPLTLRRLVGPRLAAVSISLCKTRPDQMLCAIDDVFTAELAIDQAPKMPPVMKIGWNPASMMRIDRETLLGAMRAVAHAISTEDTRYYLNGIYINPSPTDEIAIAFVATDGHRLARRVVTGVRHNLKSGFIIPRHAVHALLKLLLLKPKDAGADDHVEICAHDLRAGIRAVNFALATRLIDGSYPDYERVIPKDSPIAATFQAQALRSFCARIAGFGGRIPRGVELQIIPHAGKMVARYCSADLGIFTSRIDAVCEGEISIGFQFQYLIAALNALKSETVSLHASDKSAPAIMASAGELADPSTTIVLMPMRI